MALSKFQSKFEAVCAIDFGTHGIGYACSFSEGGDVYTHEFEDAPGSIKTLNFIVMDKNTRTLKSFGYAGLDLYLNMRKDEQKKYATYTGYKMNLMTNNDGSRSPIIKSQNGDHECEISVLVAMVLKAIKNEALNKMKSANPGLTEDKILWVETVPAIWDPAAKQVMVQAAVDAGMCLPDLSNLKIALEPEAAALQCRAEKVFQMKEGTTFMVIDVGGGTADITCHKVVKEGLEEIIAPDGGPWGATYIDKYFEAFLKQVFGHSEIEMLKLQHPAEWLAILTEFERKKRKLTDNNDPISLRIMKFLETALSKEILQKKVSEYNKTVTVDKQVDTMDSILWIEAATFKSFQKPLVEKISAKVKGMLARPELRNLEYVQLVGGFAESILLKNEMTTLLKETSVKLVVPNRPSWAVLMGAVRYGYNPWAIQNRIASYSIGIEKLEPWDSTAHDEDKKMEIQGKVWCKDAFHAFVKCGDSLKCDSQISEIFYPVHKGQKEVTIPIVTSKSANVRHTDEPGVMLAGNLHLVLPERSDEDTPIKVSLSFGGTVFYVKAEAKFKVAKAEFKWDFQPGPKPPTVYQSLDLCFAMDCTGSMASWIKIAKEKIVDIGNAITSNNPGVRIRIGFIGYRDFEDKNQFEIVNLTEDFVSIKNFLEQVKAQGGGDTPEDIHGALEQVKQLDWKSSCRVLVHVADAPCHGSAFHDYEDNHKDATPPNEIVADLLKDGIAYNFVKINNSTDKMTSTFDQIAKEYNGTFEMRNLQSDTSLFMPTVLEFVANSIASRTNRY